ncbi:MAG TPA: RNA 2',3'-cyclic phosphodiesterase [Clostridia bacterium]|nr:RNA 2',3'-cyclic phosphodiesterase [Clostridia bacterium]
MRAFVAIHLPDSFADWLEVSSARLGMLLSKVALVPAASCHVTLRFLGELPGEQVDAAAERLRESISAVPGTTLVLDRFGVFRRGGRPAVLWIGPSVVSEALVRLAASTDACMSGMGSNTRIEPFVPHVTLGRFVSGTRDGDAATIEAQCARPYAVPVTDVVLYESLVGQGKPTYVARASVRLAPFAE